MMLFGKEIALKLIAMVAGVILLIVAVSLFVRSCDKRRSEAAQSRVSASQAQAAQDSARDAINAVEASGARETASEALTRENEANIRAAPGASDPVNPAVRDAGLAALCRRAAYQNDPRCKR
jgi:hypothetical protein